MKTDVGKQINFELMNINVLFFMKGSKIFCSQMDI